MKKSVAQNGEIKLFVDGVSLEPLSKAAEKLKQFLPNTETEQQRAGIIQAFEYSFELAWKAMRKVLKTRGLVANSPKEVIRAAAAEGLIDDAELWFDFLQKRNITSHTYNEPDAMAVISVCPSFLLELTNFIKKVCGSN